MRPSDENELLLQVLGQLESPPHNPRLTRAFLPAAWLASVVAFAVLFQVAEHISPALLGAVCAGLGAIIGIVLYARECARQEPVLRPHIDRESIRRRLAELGT
jgi:predicted secreted protein